MISRFKKTPRNCYLAYQVHIMLPITIIGFSSLSLAEENLHGRHDKIQINVTSKLPILGDLNIQDDFLFGTEFKYFLKHSGRHHLFVSGGYLTDSDNTGGSIDIFNIDLGSQFDLRKLWGKRNYIEYSAGITYTNEEYAFDLLDRDVKNSYSESGFKASLGYGLDLFQDIGTKLSIDQYGNSTTLGFNVYYQF